MVRVKLPLLIGTLVVGMGAVLHAPGAEEPANLPPKHQFHVYLLMGQSNMAGRGKMTEADRRPVERVWMLNKQNRWVPAAHPVHFDKPAIAGVGLGIDFAKGMCREDPDVQIGLIPCAFGGTPLSRWSKGGDLYKSAVARAKVAMKDGTIKGMLWHQGESDSGTAETATTYGQRLAKMIAALRAELERPDLPFVAGKLGEFYLRSGRSPHAATVDAALADLPNQVERAACASAEGLDHKGDQVHFSAEAMRQLGKRYAAEMIRLLKDISKRS